MYLKPKLKSLKPVVVPQTGNLILRRHSFCIYAVERTGDTKAGLP